MNDIGIINRALIKMGEKPIASTSQPPLGTMMGILYEEMRKSLLSAHFWSFALKRASLSRLDEETGSKLYPYAYALPVDFLILKDFGEAYKSANFADMILMPDCRYVIEQNKLLCNIKTDVGITYVADIKEPHLFSPYFAEALIAMIAAEAVLTVNASTSLKTLFLNEAQSYILKAANNNEIARDMESLPDNSWVTCRDNWGMF